MRVGIDTYSFHRMLGHLRPGEPAATVTLSDGGPAAIRLARHLGADVVALQTCLLPPAAELDLGALAAAADGCELLISWGAPDGLAYGAAPAATADALAWLPIADTLGGGVMRIVLGGPALRDREDPEIRRHRSLPPLRLIADAAAELGMRVAIENHGDIGAADLLATIETADHPALGVCFDSANALRVGDDPVAAATLLADHVLMVHLKDVAAIDDATDPIAGPESVPYGTGVIRIEAVLDALAIPVAARRARLRRARPARTGPGARAHRGVDRLAAGSPRQPARAVRPLGPRNVSDLPWTS